jgi:hypothetical protein
MRRKTSGLPGETLLRHVSSLDTEDDAWLGLANRPAHEGHP